MFENLLREDVQKFIIENTGKDSSVLALSKNPFPEIDYKVLLNQIECRTKSRQKLPTWFSTKGCIYPDKTAIEQTSSEATASYKSELLSGSTIIDLTGGFGVDCYYFAKKMQRVWHCELNPKLSKIVAHNTTILNTNNIICMLGDGSEILQDLAEKPDWIYIDPSRRNDVKGKVFMLKDCSPDVSELLDIYLQYANTILIKTSPLLDISIGMYELKFVKEIHVVALDNEVKELLWVIEKNFNGNVVFKTVNIQKEKRVTYSFAPQNAVTINYGMPKRYLYEPNAAIMKSGGYAFLTDTYPVQKLHKHAHLFTADVLVDFPGRIFEITQVEEYSKKAAKTFLEKKKMNVSTRNFPETADALVKKWKIKDGGEVYTFFTTNLNEAKIMLFCAKL